MEIVMLILAVITFIYSKDRRGKTDLDHIQQQLKEDSILMWWERIKTGKETRTKYKRINLHTGKKNY